jgi:hypothetical protein
VIVDERRELCGNNSGDWKCLYLSLGIKQLLGKGQQIILMEEAQ